MGKTVHVTPPCPMCQSKRTGYKISYIGYFNDELIARHLRRGELVRPSPVSFDNNLFCEDCGLEWTGETIIAKLNKKELQSLKTEKGISKEYIEEKENSSVYDCIETRRKKRRKAYDKVTEIFRPLSGIKKEDKKENEAEKPTKKRGPIKWAVGVFAAAIIEPIKDAIPKNFKGINDISDNREDL